VTSGPPTAVLAIHVRPGSSRSAIAYDPWRKGWTVSCRAPAEEGRANREVLELVAGWLELSPRSVRWRHAGRARDKTIEVVGLTEEEIATRLARAAGAPPVRPLTGRYGGLEAEASSGERDPGGAPGSQRPEGSVTR
jgi:uncharacterized protein (TIGR00251 family)